MDITVEMNGAMRQQEKEGYKDANKNRFILYRQGSFSTSLQRGTLHLRLSSDARPQRVQNDAERSIFRLCMNFE